MSIGGSQDTSFGSHVDTLRQIAKREGNRPVEGVDGLKLAQVLYVFGEDEKVNVMQDYSVYIPKKENEKSKLVKIIARIPTIHDIYEEPTDELLKQSREKASGFDYKMTPIFDFPVFIALNEDVGLPAVGNYVWVQYNQTSSSKFGVFVSIAEGKYEGKPEGGTTGGGASGGASDGARVAAAQNIHQLLGTKPIKKTWFKKDVIKDSALIDKKNFKEPYKHFIEDGIHVYDCRGFFNPPKLGLFVRPLSSISGIVVHRTSCVIGDKPHQHAKTNAHVAVTLEGNIYLMHPFNMGIYHAQNISETTIGVEFDGNPEVFKGGPYWISPDYKKNGKPMDRYLKQIGPHPTTEQQVRASKVLLNIIIRELKLDGGKITCVFAHRQSTEGKAGDPGWECWQKIAMPWQRTLSAKSTISFRVDTGKPIPKEWDPSSSHKWHDKT